MALGPLHHGKGQRRELLPCGTALVLAGLHGDEDTEEPPGQPDVCRGVRVFLQEQKGSSAERVVL